MLSPSLYKNIHLLPKVDYLAQKFYSLFRQGANFITLLSIYFCISSIFFMRTGVSHSNTVNQIVSLSKIDCPIYQEENSPPPKKFSWNYSLVIKIHLKLIMSNLKLKSKFNTSVIQSLKGLWVDFLYNLFLSEPWFFSIAVLILLTSSLVPTEFLGYTPANFFIRMSIYLLKWETIWNDLKPSKINWNYLGTIWNKPRNN